MKILALGNAGFIGSHLTGRLLEKGHEITGIDIYDDKISEYLDHERFSFIKEDIRRPGFSMDDYVKDHDLVIDLIAYANPGLYVKIPLEVFRLNFTENLKIAEACVRHQKRLIQFSSCEVYGKTTASLADLNLNNPEDPALAVFKEDTTDFILGPVGKTRWIYSCAKQLLERVLHAYGEEHGFTYSIIRPFNFIGPKIDYLLDETDGLPRVFSFFMDALINGTEMKLVDGGSNRRCYTYIDDAVDCIMLIVANPDGACDRQIFNIGSPFNEVSIKQLAYLMRELYAEYFRDPRKSLPLIVDVSSEEFYGTGYEDSDRRIPNIDKARKLLGWEPRWRLKQMLLQTMNYYVTEYGEKVRAEQKRTGFKHDIYNRAGQYGI